ncbi:MAG: LysM peptidoglycan-binding domain-containing protein [Desulfobulbaceae bacterium]|nr:LysM peptidoglycan-binding domain-containing protein [Desulfobulbaceae bacterium]
MRSSQFIHLVYFLCLITPFVCAGCAPKPKPVLEVEPAPEPVIEQPVEEYSDSKYVEGDEAYPEGYYIHTVSVPGENISIIAKWYTGEQKNWVVLVKCNSAIKPNRIFLGNEIKIPRSIMTRDTELPAEFVRQSYSGAQRKKTTKAPVAQTQTAKPATQPAAEEKPTQATKQVEEEPLFFGPKGY